MKHINKFTLIVGAMKCGTTTLFNYLAQHPQVCGSKVKEPMFFSSPTFTSDLNQYLDLWPAYESKIHKTAVEASTEYTKYPAFPNVADRIFKFSNDYDIGFKFIYIMRDPLDMISSGLRHGQDNAWISGNRQAILEHLIQVADFSKQICNYYDKFPAEDILLVTFDDLTKDPLTLMKKIACFLNIDSSFEFTGLGRVFNSKTQRARNMRRHNFREKLSKIKSVNYISRHSPRYIKRMMNPIIDKLVEAHIPFHNWKHPVAWRLDDEERRLIINKLHMSVLKLGSEHNIDVSYWLKR